MTVPLFGAHRLQNTAAAHSGFKSGGRRFAGLDAIAV